MNERRRKQIREIRDLITRAVDMLETVQSDEQEAYDNMPESLQGGTKGETAQETLDLLETMSSTLADADMTIDELVMR